MPIRYKNDDAFDFTTTEDEDESKEDTMLIVLLILALIPVIIGEFILGLWEKCKNFFFKMFMECGE